MLQLTRRLGPLTRWPEGNRNRPHVRASSSPHPRSQEHEQDTHDTQRQDRRQDSGFNCSAVLGHSLSQPRAEPSPVPLCLVLHWPAPLPYISAPRPHAEVQPAPSKIGRSQPGVNFKTLDIVLPYRGTHNLLCCGGPVENRRTSVKKCHRCADLQHLHSLWKATPDDTLPYLNGRAIGNVEPPFYLNIVSVNEGLTSSVGPDDVPLVSHFPPTPEGAGPRRGGLMSALSAALSGVLNWIKETILGTPAPVPVPVRANRQHGQRRPPRR